VRQAISSTLVLLAPMLAVLVFVIMFPGAILALPRWVMPQFVQ
jgi:hypothetical protein